MKILVNENDEKDLLELMSLLYAFQENQETKLEIKVENNCDVIMNIINDYDVAFFDIELNDEINGIDLACKIREVNRDIRIIFISNFSQYLVDGYKAKADLYLLKPIEQNEFNKNMKKILWDYIYHDMGIYDLHLSQTKIYFRDILYIEMLQRKCNFHFINKNEISYFDSLLRWKNILKDAPFSQPHRSFLVNMQHIVQYKNKEILLRDNCSIPITDTYNQSFREDYIRFLNGVLNKKNI